MDELTPTDSASATPPRRYRWVWRVCWLLLLVLFVAVLYLVLTARPAFYSSATTLRPSSDYDQKLDPTRSNVHADTVSNSAPPVITATTNAGKIRIEYPKPKAHSVEILGFAKHQIEGSEKIQLGDVSLQLKRIGYAWVPPPTNSSGSNLSPVPARFFDAELKPIAEAEILREFPNSWEREMETAKNFSTYRFDLEILGEPWRVLDVSLYDATTHAPLTSGSSIQYIKNGYKYSTSPFLWRSTPVALMVDLAVGPLEEEEFLPQPGGFFSLAGRRYYLLFATDDPSAGSYSQITDAKKVSIQFTPLIGQRPSVKESYFLYQASPYAAQAAFHFEYLDAEGKIIARSGGNTSNGELMQNVPCELAAIKKIRVRKFRMAHRVVIRLPALPGLPPENESVDNLFQVRAPLLKFTHQSEQQEYIRRMTQLDMSYLSSTNFPANIYPRWFTNATTAEVLEDYAQIMGVQGQLFVDQERLLIENGKLPWPLEMQRKMLKQWEKLRGP